jgi:hypothetical protein
VGTAFYRRRAASGAGPHTTEPFITISREAGAGGHALAETLLAEFARREDPACRDWQLFNNALLDLASREPWLKENLSSIVSEDYFDLGHDYIRQVLGGKPPQDVVLRRVFSSLRSVACLGRAVILGRAGACVAGDMGGGIHIRLVAGPESRLERLRAQLGLKAESARRKMQALDASRAALVRRHFGRDIADPTLYAAVWNTDKVSMAEIARWAADRVLEKSRRLQASQRAASSA